MYGTAKQIAWAKDIINKTNNAFNTLVEIYGEAPLDIYGYVNGVLNDPVAQTIIESPFRQVSTSRDLLEVLAFEGLEWEVTP